MNPKKTETDEKNKKLSENLIKTVKSFSYGTVTAFIFGILIVMGCVIIVSYYIALLSIFMFIIVYLENF